MEPNCRPDGNVTKSRVTENEISMAEVKRRAQISSEVQEDLERYLRYSVREEIEFSNLTAQQILFELRKFTHKIEKGLAFAQPRRPFGLHVREVLETLIGLSDPSPERQHAEATIRALDLWNEKGVIDDEIAPALTLFPQPDGDEFAAFERLIKSRHSVRDFDLSRRPDPMSMDRAVRIAMSSTPSGCNRQPWNVRILTERKSIDTVLSHQDGNAGFGQQIPALAVVTVDGAMFFAMRERNARLVEGGLFAMTLLLALHACGFSTCMLNCSLSNAAAHELRTILGTLESEDFVVMIAIGYPRIGTRIAQSRRFDGTDLPA